LKAKRGSEQCQEEQDFFFVSEEWNRLIQESIEALIEAASIETRGAQRDAHRKSADFFHVEKFPTLSGAARLRCRQSLAGAL